jgi:hypothetical protein
VTRPLPLAALAALLALPVPAPAAEPAAPGPGAELAGTWRGTSTCVRFPGNEACRDEVVVYVFRPSPGRPAALELDASKIVGGEQVPMGPLDGFARDPGTGRWNAEYRNARVHIVWSFEVRGDALTGTCTAFGDPKVVYRTVVARRDSR